MKTKESAFALVPILLVAACIAASAWIFKPALLPGAAHRAAASVETTKALVTADTARASAAAASVVKIAEANTDAPDSPAKSFISQESTVALAHLPAPDAQALVEAERRRAAVFAGERDEARRLYAQADAKAARLSKERDEALDAKHTNDTALVAAAAAGHAAAVQRLILCACLALALALYGYAKFYGITPARLGAAVADIRQGVPPVQAIDSALAPWLHAHVARAAALATPPPPDPAKTA